MPEQEQHQPDISELQGASEPKESWGSPESKFDQDGFIRTEEERRNEGLGHFVANVVDARETARLKAPEIGESDVLSSRDALNAALLSHEQAHARAATRRDMQEHHVDYRTVRSAHQIYEDNPTLENRDAYTRLERQRDWQANQSSDWASYEKPDAVGIYNKFDVNRYHERRAVADVHQLLDLNVEGLSGISVEAFVGLMDRRTDLKEKIQSAKEVIRGHQITLERIARKFKGRQKPFPVPGSQREHFDGADDVMNDIVGVGRSGINQELDVDEAAIQTDFKQINQLLDDSFDISPKEYLEGCQEITQRMKSRIEAKLLELEQLLKDFDERMKAGDFTEDEAIPEEKSVGVS